MPLVRRLLLAAVLFAPFWGRAATPAVAPVLYVDPGTLHASTAGDIYLRWPGDPMRHYRVETSTNLVNWTDLTETVCLDGTCSPMVKRHPVPPDPIVRKFWRVTPFDVDSDGDGINDHAETLAGTDPFAGTRIPLRCHFVPFGLCLSNSSFGMSTAAQITTCQAAGYTGYALASFGSEVVLKAFADNPEVTSGRFRIYSALWWLKVTSVFDWTDIDRRLAQAARMGMAIWVVVEGTKEDPVADREQAYAILRTAAQHCAAQGVRLVLYPHQGTTYATAEAALAFLLRIRADPDLTAAEKAGVSLSIHLCHELKARNGARIAEVVAAVAPYCTLASISGAEADTVNRPGWDSGILPLDQGSYDVRPFLRALADSGYTSPLCLITYNLPDPRIDDHLKRSLIRWRQLVAPPAP